MDTKVLCILSTLLGNKAMAGRVRDALERLPGVTVTYVLLEPEDYQNTQPPGGPVSPIRGTYSS